MKLTSLQLANVLLSNWQNIWKQISVKLRFNKSSIMSCFDSMTVHVFNCWILIIAISLCTIFKILLTFLGKSCNSHMLYASIISILSQGLILNSRRSYTTFGTKIHLFAELIQSDFWVQNGKNDGFTKMSVES